MKVNGKKILTHEETGLHYREETSDLWIIDEGKTYKKLFKQIKKGDTFLDLGACIGSTAYYALQNGAKKVVSVEPDEGNLKVLRMQDVVKNKKVIVVPKAVSTEDGTCKLYISSKKFKAGHTMYKSVRGRDYVEVETVSFEKILKKVKPRILKIDVEGEEFNLDLDLIVKYNVKAVAIEIHTDMNREKAIKVFDWFAKNFKQLNRSKISNYPATLFIGVRE
jgi:FkbM family methyltransferase